MVTSALSLPDPPAAEAAWTSESSAMPSATAVATFSPAEAATHTSTSPGSTTRVRLRSVNARRVVGTSNRTVADSPGASATRW